MIEQSDDAKSLASDLRKNFKGHPVSDCWVDDYKLHTFVIKCLGKPNLNVPFSGPLHILEELKIRVSRTARANYVTENFNEHFLDGPGNWRIYATKNLGNISKNHNDLQFNGVLFEIIPPGHVRITPKENDSKTLYVSDDNGLLKPEDIGGLRIWTKFDHSYNHLNRTLWIWRLPS